MPACRNAEAKPHAPDDANHWRVDFIWTMTLDRNTGAAATASDLSLATGVLSASNPSYALVSGTITASYDHLSDAYVTAMGVNAAALLDNAGTRMVEYADDA